LTTTLSFPAGTVTQTTSLVLTPTVSTAGAGLTFAGHAFELEAYQDGLPQPGFVFSAPVTVTIQYSEVDVRLVSEESELTLQRWIGDGRSLPRAVAGWADAADTCDPPLVYERDLDNHVLSLPICHLSTFGLFGPTESVYLPVVLRSSR
jgi:hypothetical protein